MKILIAEDDPVALKLLETVLKKMGHDVTSATDGLEAWKKYIYRDEYFQVVITDWMMPDLEGPQLCRMIRDVATGRQYTYVVLLTVLDTKNDYLAGMDAGADDFFVKPFDEDYLRVRLRVAERILGLRQHVARLEGLLPICSYCKNIRDAEEKWHPVEAYVRERSDVSFSHGVCPDCMAKAKNDLNLP